MTVRPVPRLHVIGPLITDPADYPAIAVAAVKGGCDAVHVRIPGGATDDLLALARTLRDLIGDVALIVNDRLDIALLAGAAGVQLGERSFSVADARQLLPAGALIGRSVHDLDGARAALADGADYLLAGHVFDTPSKQGVPGRGLDWLAELASVVPIPVIALGGITIERVPGVLEAGAHGVALGRELLRSTDPAASARRVAEILFQ
ncbi:MAG TPA: thiamine phosphate synthase [Thermomicrobiales bacterium]|nr:thiamine phosphate synthase [Thermomicrobiales bacterium]